MIFVINGTDIVPFALPGGISWRRVDVNGNNSMTMQDGSQLEDRIAARFEWTFKFRAMTADEQAALLALLTPGSVDVQFTSPETHTVTTAVYYVSQISAGYLTRRTNGFEYWGGMSATFSSRAGLVSF